MHRPLTLVGILLSLLLGTGTGKPLPSGGSHHPTPPETEHTPRFSSTSALPCIEVVRKLTPQAPAFLFSVKAYAQYQKDITGESRYTAPTHAGIRLEVPLYDPREKWQIKERYLRSLNFARRLLADYLSLRYEVEEMKRFLKWMWKRVDAGIEYRRDVWREEIKLKQKEGELKALTALLISAGIDKNLLDRCYESSSK